MSSDENNNFIAYQHEKEMSKKMEFEVLLEKHESNEATGITIPFDVENVFGAKRVPVKVSINNVEYRSTIMRMGGKYCMVVPKKIRDAAVIKAGDCINVSIERDTQERIVEMPPDLAAAVSQSNLQSVWEKLSFTHQKEYVQSITDAKREETRSRRIRKTIEYLINKRK